jgi:acetylornithine deacetylase/succinyl-diaminopimelate desuccinylase-like protein
MSDSTMRPVMGQESTDPTATEDILDFLASFTAYLDENLPRVRAACERLDARIKAQREEEGDDAPDTDLDPPHVPGLAFRSDGKTLLHVAHVDVIPADRELWTGIVLSPAEAGDVLDRISDASDEAAGHVGGYIIASNKRKKSEEDDDGGGA